MLNKWKVGIAILAFGLVVPASNAQRAEKAPKVAQDDGVRQVLMNLQGAITSKNVANATALLSDDVRFIDEAGEETSGRKAMTQRFEELFNASIGTDVGIHPQSINFPADNVALVIGEVSRKREQVSLPVSKFSMMMVRKNNVWQISAITETAMQPAPAPNLLPELNWLVGEWGIDNADGSAVLNVEWTPNKKFLTSKTTITRKGQPPQLDTQVIGWDPQRNTIISWHFDNNGGYGNGIWTKLPSENKWKVDVAGVGADGSNTIATNIFDVKTGEQFVWQSVHRTVDGAPLADTTPLTLNRIKH